MVSIVHDKDLLIVTLDNGNIVHYDIAVDIPGNSVTIYDKNANRETFTRVRWRADPEGCLNEIGEGLDNENSL